MRYQQGDGVRRDSLHAERWLRKAAEGGDVVAQTMYAIALRSTRESRKLAESIEWLRRAAAKGYGKALFTLAVQQMVGWGTQSDPKTAAVNMMRAALLGEDGSRAAFEELESGLSESQWEEICSHISWPALRFTIGSPPEGAISKIFDDSRNMQRDHSSLSTWLAYERDISNAFFLESKGSSVLEALFGVPVVATSLSVGAAWVRGEWGASISISLSDIHRSNGRPVWWGPDMDALTQVGRWFLLVAGRQWQSTSYIVPNEYPDV